MPERSQDKKYDIFIANKIYPNPVSVFKAEYKSINHIKDSASIVFDTNVLLLPYTVSSASLGEIKKIYLNLVEEKRLFIPGQVAREFANNRPIKICDLHKALLDKKSKLDIFKHERYPLLEDIEDYIELIKIEKEIEDLTKEYKKKIDGVLDKIRSWNWDDPVSLMYSQILSEDSIIELKFDEQSLLNDLETRQIHKIPPGYKDAAKDDKGIGDLLIWKTLLLIGKNQNNDVIFVTSDLKADWWYGSNKQNIYPRYELIGEFRRETDCKTIHIIEFSRLLNLYGASDDIVAEVKNQEYISKFLNRIWFTNYNDDIENNPKIDFAKYIKNYSSKDTTINEDIIVNLLVNWFLSHYSPMDDTEEADFEDEKYNCIHTGSSIILNLFKETFSFAPETIINKVTDKISDISWKWKRTKE